MLNRRFMALLLALGMSSAALGPASAESMAKSALSFLIPESETTTTAKERFDADGVPKSPLWQSHWSGQSLFTFKPDGTGKVLTRGTSLVGTVFDRSLQDDKTILGAEETVSTYRFRYTVGKNSELKVYITPGSYISQIITGSRKGLVETIYLDDTGGRPNFEGYFDRASKRFMRTTGGYYFRRTSTGLPDSYGYGQKSGTGWEIPTETVAITFTIMWMCNPQVHSSYSLGPCGPYAD